MFSISSRSLVPVLRSGKVVIQSDAPDTEAMRDDLAAILQRFNIT